MLFFQDPKTVFRLQYKQKKNTIKTNTKELDEMARMAFESF